MVSEYKTKLQISEAENSRMDGTVRSLCYNFTGPRVCGSHVQCHCLGHTIKRASGTLQESNQGIGQ